MTGEEPALARAQTRLLRRIFNGRAIPLVVDGRDIHTYREAVCYLLELKSDARERAYAAIKAQAKLARVADGADGESA